MQLLLLESISRILRKADFDFVMLTETKSRCFDLVARKKDELYLIKVLYNVDSLKPDVADELKKLANLLKAVPLVVGEKFKTDFLERGVVYTRYGVPVVSVATFYDYVVEKIPIFIYSAPGGYYVKLDGEKIREARERLGMSIGEVSKCLGVSRRTIKKYEEGIDTNLETAVKMEELFGIEVIKSLDFKSFVNYEFKAAEEEEIKDRTLVKLKEIGLDVYPVKQAPFDAISDAAGNTIITGVREVRELRRRVILIGEISRVTEKIAAYITEKQPKLDIKSVVFILKDELDCVNSAKDFVYLIEEKSKGSLC
ncbi:MAG: transcriptional regulator [Archaeoglobaceae archaeon]|nr:transcriptional regulator [Archaeoglobaceae archaeon]MCX8151893.1 transcriptional regulator [Archaeoglobaceae archaeon]MDW8013282.1 transcriptional regulator [Archaeoglobaceae archaeon]